MGLKNVLQKMKDEKESNIGERLFDFARSRGTAEILPMKPGDLFRASSLPFLCPREEVLSSRYDIIRARHIDPGMQITFDIGHYFHDLYRDVYFGPMGEFAGSWECIKCGWNTDKAGLSEAPVSKGGCVKKGRLVKMPKECGACGAPFWVGANSNDTPCGHFREWSIKDHDIGLSGHPDGWNIPLFGKRTIVDIKSHGYNGFSSRRSLRDGHDLQILAYCYMCGDKDASVWYLNKSPWGDHASFIKKIDVRYDKDVIRKDILRPLDLLRNGLNGGKLPDRLCIGPDVPRAKSCQLGDLCFD